MKKEKVPITMEIYPTMSLLSDAIFIFYAPINYFSIFYDMCFFDVLSVNFLFRRAVSEKLIQCREKKDEANHHESLLGVISLM